jgi:hypothetical protein
MFNLTDYKFEKPYYRQGEFLELFSISLATLKRYMEEWVNNGNNLQLMGHLNIIGFRETCWEPKTFLNWLIENKLEAPVKYDFELSEQKKLAQNVINIPKKQQQLKGVQ